MSHITHQRTIENNEKHKRELIFSEQKKKQKCLRSRLQLPMLGPRVCAVKYESSNGVILQASRIGRASPLTTHRFRLPTTSPEGQLRAIRPSFSDSFRIERRLKKLCARPSAIEEGMPGCDILETLRSVAESYSLFCSYPPIFHEWLQKVFLVACFFEPRKNLVSKKKKRKKCVKQTKWCKNLVCNLHCE